ncbi:hypothetical protein ACFQ3Z_45695 [Streptomyces nogalater]
MSGFQPAVRRICAALSACAASARPVSGIPLPPQATQSMPRASRRACSIHTATASALSAGADTPDR